MQNVHEEKSDLLATTMMVSASKDAQVVIVRLASVLRIQWRVKFRISIPLALEKVHKFSGSGPSKNVRLIRMGRAPPI